MSSIKPDNDTKPLLTASCPMPSVTGETIQLAHGGGGKLTQQLIDGLFLPHFSNDALNQQGDGALLAIETTVGTGSGKEPVKGIAKLVFSTDSYVVNPLFFPGGNIGTLSVSGTVNDVAMMGATPKYLSLGLIIEEGFPLSDLTNIIESIAIEAKKAGVQVVTGDTKVVDKGHGDGLYINTAGIGVIEHSQTITPQRITVGDKIILSGDIGRHGMCVLNQREQLGFSSELISDVNCVHEPVLAMLSNDITLHCMRDLTRGGLATSLIELAQTVGLSFSLNGAAIPVSNNVQAIGELLGIDPLYVANEGRFIIIAPADQESLILETLARYDVSEGAVTIGEVMAPLAGEEGLVSITNAYGAQRVLSLLTGEQLPRIC